MECGGVKLGGRSADLLLQREACEQQIAHSRESTTAAASAFSAELLSARSHANHTLSLREKLNGLKDQLKRLEADRTEALSIQANKGSKYKHTRESISNATATNEQLRSLVMDQRAKRDEFTNVISNQLKAVEALEANIDATGKKKLENALIWYDKFLGLQVVGGEGVKFVFNKIDMHSPDNEYSFCIKVNKERYNLLQCVPYLNDSEELVKDLNCTNDLFKFVRIMRTRFQAVATNGVRPARSLCSDTSSIITSSQPALSSDTASESTSDQSDSRNQAKDQYIHSKKGGPSRSVASPHTTLSIRRRSLRIVAADAGNRL